MSSDTLDQATDAELNELFAVEVAETMERIDPQHGEARAYAMKGTGAYRSCEWRDHFTDFATDANAVLPYLEKDQFVISNLSSDGVTVELFKDYPGIGPEYNCPQGPSTEVYAQGAAPILARAACIALIRARRAGK